MSYHLYTTKGIIFAERPTYEADRIYTIFTRDLGKIQAQAIGVRKNTSKIRGNIEPFSLSNLSLVKGRNYWKLTSAESIKKIPAPASVARSFALMEKLIQGEEPHPELFDAVEHNVLSFQADDEMFEVRLVSQVLFHLGYLKRADLGLDKKSLIKAINNGIQSSQLA